MGLGEKMNTPKGEHLPHVSSGEQGTGPSANRKHSSRGRERALSCEKAGAPAVPGAHPVSVILRRMGRLSPAHPLKPLRPRMRCSSPRTRKESDQA